ncbi:hypothetical protein LF65_01447 [Clostridium beijerinckii]|uniref:DUF1275 family protein n=1 Tax=Clostridium beijerinckii TaxID=1520 RepID=A0A0B5Q793_CLOBE|nr:YoaK family protein [Clostridium beijerinckii]AJG98059.1 hypothetical protein LF65_01447 [Clostridium beijerinckii]
MITKDIHINAIKKMHIHTKTSESVRLGILLAIVGGFLDAYTFVCRGEVFANAQTGNLVLLGIALTKRNSGQAITALLPILAFVLGVIFTEKIKDIKVPSMTFATNAERIILIIEIIVLFIIGFVPTTVPHIFVIVPIAFVSSVQIASFGKLIDSPYSTAMCTGNLRSASQAAYKAFIEKDKKLALKSIRYLVIIFFFIVGAFLGGILTLHVGGKSIWFAVVILIISVVLFSIDKYIFDQNAKEQITSET